MPDAAAAVSVRIGDDEKIRCFEGCAAAGHHARDGLRGLVEILREVQA